MARAPLARPPARPRGARRSGLSCRAGRGPSRRPSSCPGDLVLLEAGGQIPADARLVRNAALSVDEAALTGESVPVEKDATARVRNQAPLAEHTTMVYLGTTVAAGTGAAIVTATGHACPRWGGLAEAAIGPGDRPV